jgi:hypothetical protein
MPDLGCCTEGEKSMGNFNYVLHDSDNSMSHSVPFTVRTFSIVPC